MSEVLKRRIRIYAFAAGLVVAIMASFDPLTDVEWPRVVIAALGLLVGIMNIHEEDEDSKDDQMGRFLIVAIGLKVTSVAFRTFLREEGFSGLESLFFNLEIFITAGLLYVTIVRMYEAFRNKFGSYKMWFYIAAIVLVLALWLLGGDGSPAWVQPTAFVLVVLGLIVGFFEGPANPEQARAQVGTRFLVAAVGFQLASEAITTIREGEFVNIAGLVENAQSLLTYATRFTTSALLVIAFMAIFWVLDEIND